MANDVYSIKAKTVDGSWWDLDVNEIIISSCDNSDYTICRRIQGLAMVSCKKSSENFNDIEDNELNYNRYEKYYIYSENIIAVKIMRLNTNE